MLRKLCAQLADYTNEYMLWVLSGEGGVAEKWNEGIRQGLREHCTHFAILNDDIEVYPNWLEDCMEAFNNGAKVVSLTAGKDLKLTNTAVPIAGWFFILSKEVIDTVGYFDEKVGNYIGEDTDYGIRCGLANIPYKLLDLPIKHHGSATISKLNREEVDERYRESFQYLRNKYPTLRFMV